MRAMTVLVNVVMGSKSDWDTMQHCISTLDGLGIGNEVRVLSAHRTPKQAVEYVEGAADRGVRVLIAAAGGAAHLAGVLAGHSTLPVLGVPMKAWALDGLDSLLSTVQMPTGIPVATFAIGKAGAINAALFAAAILAHDDPAIKAALDEFRRNQTENILKNPDPRK